MAPFKLLLFFCAFLAFNLTHQRNQEGTLKILEDLVGIRKRFTRQGAKIFFAVD